MYAAILLITAAGNPEQVQKGRKTIRNAIVGIVIIFVAYELVGLIMYTLVSGQLKDFATKSGQEVEIRGVGEWNELEKLRQKCFDISLPGAR